MEDVEERPWKGREREVQGREPTLLAAGGVLLFPFIIFALFVSSKDLPSGLARKLLTKIFADAIIGIRPWMIIFSSVVASYLQDDFLHIYHIFTATYDFLLAKEKVMGPLGFLFLLYLSIIPDEQQGMLLFVFRAAFLANSAFKSSFGFIDVLRISLTLYSANRPGDDPAPYAVQLLAYLL